MSTDSQKGASVLLESLISPGIEFKYDLSARWIDSNQPKLLVTSKINTLTQIISDKIPDWSYSNSGKFSDEKYIARTRKILDILKYKLCILDDLRLDKKAEKKRFFLLNLWEYEDLNYFRNELNKRWKKAKGEDYNDFFQTDLIFQIILEAIPFPIFYKDSNTRVYKGYNRKFRDFLGREKQHLLDKTVYDVALPNESKIYDTKDMELLEGFPDIREQFYFAYVGDRNSEQVPVIFCKGSFTGINNNHVAGIIGMIIKLTDKNVSFMKKAIEFYEQSPIKKHKRKIEKSYIKRAS